MTKRTSTRAVAGVVVVGCLLLSGCLGGPGKETGPAQRRAEVKSWASNAGYASDNSYIVGDLAAISNGRALKDLSGLRTECEGLSADASNLYGELPTPVESLTSKLNTSLEGFDKASFTCYSLSSFTSSTYKKFSTELHRAEVAYDEATRQLRSFDVG